MINPVPVGEPRPDIRTATVRYPQAGIVPVDPREAMSQVLVEVLAGAVFYRRGGAAGDIPFQLEQVFTQWPGPETVMNYPSASVIDELDTEHAAHSFVPTPLEDTRDVFCDGTMLWKTGEATTTFQVDVWARHDEVLAAVLSQLSWVFNPSEDRSGIVLPAGADYYCRPVRLSLLSYRRVVDSDAAFQQERRGIVRVRADVDAVHLRRYALLETVVTTNVTAPSGAEG